MRELRYPVLIYTPNYMLGGLKAPADLLVAGNENFEDGCFENAVIIDANGDRFEVTQARKVKKALSIWTFLEFDNSIWVDLDLSEPKRLSLEEVKQEVIDVAIGNRFVLGSSNTKKSWQESIRSMSSIQDVINRVSSYQKRRSRR